MEHLHIEPGKALGLRFEYLDILKADEDMPQLGSFDIVICNPPYISPTENKDMSRSVRKWEPMEALCPPYRNSSFFARPSELFYERIAQLLDNEVFKSKIILLEIGGSTQSRQVQLIMKYKNSPRFVSGIGFLKDAKVYYSQGIGYANWKNRVWNLGCRRKWLFHSWRDRPDLPHLERGSIRSLLMKWPEDDKDAKAIMAPQPRKE